MWPGSLWGELWYKGKPIFESHPPWDSINASSKGRSMLPHFLCFLRKSWSELTLHSCGQRPTFLPNQLSPPEPKRLFFDSLCSISPPFSWFPVLQTVSLAWVCLRHIHSLLHSNFLSWKYPTDVPSLCLSSLPKIPYVEAWYISDDEGADCFSFSFTDWNVQNRNQTSVMLEIVSSFSWLNMMHPDWTLHNVCLWIFFCVPLK